MSLLHWKYQETYQGRKRELSVGRRRKNKFDDIEKLAGLHRFREEPRDQVELAAGFGIKAEDRAKMDATGANEDL